MKKDNTSNIVKRFVAGRFSPETEEKVQEWFINEQNEEEKRLASFDFWNEADSEPDGDAYAALEKVNRRIGYPRKPVPLYKRLIWVAAVLIPVLLIGGGYLYYTYLQDGYVEVVAAYGEDKHLVLPDASEVWLNSGTTIRYPKKRDADRRLIYLEGEAYFSVKKDASRVFIVKTDGVVVQVLGTEFNVKAYPDEEKIVTTLVKGKVEVYVNADKPLLLHPDEQLIYDRNTSEAHIEKILPEESNAWLSGGIVFVNSSFKEILQTLERHFNVSFQVDPHISISHFYTVKFTRNENLDEILNVLMEVVHFTYQKEDDKIVLVEKRAE